MVKRIKILFTILVLSIVPYFADACSGGYYACGGVTVERMIVDAYENCPSGSTFFITTCDGQAFKVKVD
jgi:hypothetical protein